MKLNEKLKVSYWLEPLIFSSVLGSYNTFNEFTSIAIYGDCSKGNSEP